MRRTWTKLDKFAGSSHKPLQKVAKLILLREPLKLQLSVTKSVTKYVARLAELGEAGRGFLFEVES